MGEMRQFEVVSIGGAPIGVGTDVGNGVHEMWCNPVFGRKRPEDLRRMKEHSERIAACLNYCEGIPTDVLTNYSPAKALAPTDLADAARGVLSRIVKTPSGYLSIVDDEPTRDAIARLNAVLEGK